MRWTATDRLIKGSFCSVSNVFDLGGKPITPLLPPSGGGGTYDGMEARVARLETDVSELKADMKAVRLDIAEIKGRVSNMPTTWQLVGLVIGMMLTVFALCFGLGFALLRLGLGS